MDIGRLYVVATPIGNLKDITARAAEVLSSVDFIAAEDTRVTSVLLNHLDIKAPMHSYHKFNEAARAESFVEKLREGKSCALVTDAGTPGISDPGALLVAAAVKADIEVISVPGASAVAAALSVSGFAFLSYAFYGFLPRKGQEPALSAMFNSGVDAFVLYESPHRIIATLEVIETIAPQARLAVCNDLTKKFERIYRGLPCEVLDDLKQNSNTNKGEYTLVVENAATRTDDDLPSETPSAALSLESHLVDICAKEHVSLKDAVDILHKSGTVAASKKEIDRKSVV